MTTNNTNTNTSKNGGENGGGFSDKLKGAAQVIHGIGDNLRGTALGSADRATSSVAGVQKNADLVTKGRAEIAEGMARMKGHSSAPQVAPAGTAPPGTAPADQGTTAGTGTSSGTGAAVGGAAIGVTDQGRQQGTGDEKTSALAGKSGPESTGPGAAQTGREAAVGTGAAHEQKDPGEAAASTGAAPEQKGPDEAAASTSAAPEQKQQYPGAAQTGREAAVGTGAVHEQKGPGEVAPSTGTAPEQKQQYPSTVSQQEGKRDDRNVPEHSQSGDIGQTRAQGTAEDRPQQMGKRSSQQKVDEQCKAEQMGVQQEGGQQDRRVGAGEGRCERIHFQGISTDEGDEQSQQTAEKPRELGQDYHGVQQEGERQGRWVGPEEALRCERVHFQGISTDEGDEHPSQQAAEKSREPGQIGHGAQQEDGQQGS
ncbi:hypothetical protein DFJ58DRAFT_746470 [Suillus subalutaceus]|uniref:uncharacterized protein n=1 Tax=Suillus subalutaceus TaxID=48586 RepID=UPI001B87BEE8|nr:uncharacterized protein DFJ58DRAFT_746470 [Suillus subalutaceus]KAG1850384.1 hypothetical protein DFJ58DRAFT_746470 [Suillus subalutaceus]